MKHLFYFIINPIMRKDILIFSGTEHYKCNVIIASAVTFSLQAYCYFQLFHPEL